MSESIVFSWVWLWGGVGGVQFWHLTNLVLFCCLSSNMKTNDEVVENICVLFSELVEYGKLTACTWVGLLSSFYLLTIWKYLFTLLEDIREEMKLNANITKVLSEAKSNFSDDEHEVKLNINCFSYSLFCARFTFNSSGWRQWLPHVNILRVAQLKYFELFWPEQNYLWI